MVIDKPIPLFKCAKSSRSQTDPTQPELGNQWWQIATGNQAQHVDMAVHSGPEPGSFDRDRHDETYRNRDRVMT